MNEIKERVQRFLKKNKMDHEDIDFDHECQKFIEDMEMGLDGQAAHLDMLATYIPMSDEISTNEPVIVMDAGGTNFRVAVVYFDDNKKPIIEDFNKYPMPGVDKEVTRDEFYETVIKYLEPIINKSDKIGFCFSYPTEILPNGDGKLIRFSKEIKINEMIGLPVGQGLIEALQKAGYSEPKKIVLLNDTVATLLGGKATYSNMPYSSFIGFILGTGTNTAYIEEGKNIPKLGAEQDSYGSMIINMESGHYSKSPTGVFDEEFDQTTTNPGDNTFEKKISGGYFGGITHTVIKGAVKENLLSDTFRQNFEGLVHELTTVDADGFLHAPYGDNLLSSFCSKDQKESEKDHTTLYYIIDSLMERAAKLSAINLAAVVIKTGKGTDPCKPVCITADGTTFYKSKGLKSRVEGYLRGYLTEQKGIYFDIVEAENPNLTGSAIAALLKL